MSRPPRWSERLLGWLLPEGDAEEVVGDLREEWARRSSGPLRHLRHGAAVLSVVAHFALRRRVRFDGPAGFRLAVRRLRRDPKFTAVAVASIALGIGVNVLMLSVARTVLFAPLPYPEADRLAVLTNDHSGSSTGGFGVAYESIRDVRERAGTVERVALYMDWQDVTYRGPDAAVRLPAAFLSAEYGEVLGLRTSLGRLFTPDEAAANVHAGVAVLGHGTWQSLFGGAPDVLGRSLDLNGQPFEVIGVLDDDRGDLRYLWGQDPVAVYLPLFEAERLIGFDLDADRGRRYLNGIVRVREGQTVRAAQEELSRISAELAQAFPRTNEGWSYHLQALDEALYEQLRAPASVVLGISVLVFALVAVNLLTLVLLRWAGRAQEIGVLRALGASRGRVVGQLLAESGLLALTGWALGALGGAWALGLLAASDAVRLPEFATLRADAGVLTTSAVAAAALALLLAFAPAASLLAGADGLDGIREGAARGSASRGRRRAQGGLVAAEVAVAFVLLVGAGLLLESFRTLRSTGYGFDTERLLLARVDLRPETLSPDELRATTVALVDEAERLAGAERAFVWSPNRLGHGNQVEILTPEGRWETAPEERLEASQHMLHPGTLERLGIPLLEGRDVAAGDDADAPRVALLSASLARALFPGTSAIDRRVETVDDGVLHRIEVVGVVADARHRTRLIEPFEGQRDVYYPYAQQTRELMTLAVRHAPDADVEALAGEVRALVRARAPGAPVFGITTMEERMREEEGPARLGALLVAVYAGLAVALAALGLYGVLSHGVRLRLREIGIRMALGADGPVLASQVVLQGLALTLAGLAAGVVLALPSARLLGAALYGVEPGAPAVYLAVALTLALASVGACTLPALRAVRVPPSDVLRSE